MRRDLGNTCSSSQIYMQLCQIRYAIRWFREIHRFRPDEDYLLLLYVQYSYVHTAVTKTNFTGINYCCIVLCTSVLFEGGHTWSTTIISNYLVRITEPRRSYFTNRLPNKNSGIVHSNWNRWLICHLSSLISHLTRRASATAVRCAVCSWMPSAHFLSRAAPEVQEAKRSIDKDRKHTGAPGDACLFRQQPSARPWITGYAFFLYSCLPSGLRLPS